MKSAGMWIIWNKYKHQPKSSYKNHIPENYACIINKWYRRILLGKRHHLLKFPAAAAMCPAAATFMYSA